MHLLFRPAGIHNSAFGINNASKRRLYRLGVNTILRNCLNSLYSGLVSGYTDKIYAQKKKKSEPNACSEQDF